MPAPAEQHKTISAYLPLRDAEQFAEQSRRLRMSTSRALATLVQAALEAEREAARVAVRGHSLADRSVDVSAETVFDLARGIRLTRRGFDTAWLMAHALAIPGVDDNRTLSLSRPLIAEDIAASFSAVSAVAGWEASQSCDPRDHQALTVALACINELVKLCRGLQLALELTSSRMTHRKQRTGGVVELMTCCQISPDRTKRLAIQTVATARGRG